VQWFLLKFKREREREERGVCVARGISYTLALGVGRWSINFVRIYPGSTRSSFRLEYYEMKINEAEDMRKDTF
jgi:hypothetical protein